MPLTPPLPRLVASPILSPPRTRCIRLSAPFSTTSARTVAKDAQWQKEEAERITEEFEEWLRGPGLNFKKPLFNEMNYVSSYDTKTWKRKENVTKMHQPFPLNPAFRSFPVLSEELKDQIYARVKGGKSVRIVSAELGVSMERVAAVVRLKEIEKRWIKEEKPLATFVTKAIHSMLPVTPLSKGSYGQINHEPIQDMPSHPFSHRQAFVPTSESRVYSRADAGKEFGLPSTEEAVPHPELVVQQRERELGVPPEERQKMQQSRDELERLEKEQQEQEAAHREKQIQIIEQGRWAWRLRPAQTGKVGFRYGVPHQDRKKGQIKIPRRVENVE